MAVVFSDSFTAADNTTLQDYSAAWVKNTADAPVDLIIKNNGVILASGSTASTYVNTTSGVLSDQLVEADIIFATSAGGVHAVIARAATAARQFYLARWNASFLQLYRFDSGAAVLLASVSAPVTTGETHRLGLRCVGNQISLEWNGATTLGPVTDSTYGSGYPGIRLAVSTGAVLVDNFTVDNLASGGDATAPTLTGPAATATGATTASGTVSTDEASGTLYYLASTNASETATTVKSASSQAVSATGSQSVTFSGLTASTTYYAHYVHRDAAGNDSAVASSASFTTSAAGDTAAPTLTGSITISALTTTSYTATWPAGSDNVAVTGYEYRIASGSWVDAGNVLTVDITGRTPGATEAFEVRAYDAVPNYSSALSTSVTLNSATATVTVTEPLKNNTGTLLASQSGITVAVLQAADLVSVHEATGLTTDASGLLSAISDAAITTGQQYHVAIKLADGSVGITGPITAS